MAGLPLKSGADFYNLEAARLRLHNLGADPTEVGAGLIYFNTSTGLNTSQKARLYTGSAWKTIAFSEDLDVAKNEDFLALQRRVDLLSGDVDTDAIINNMKEVSAFLEGFAEDASLMDLLNGKLNTSGGTINGNLLIGAPDNTSYRYLQFARSGYGSRINVADGDLYISFGGIDANGGLTATKVFSLGNNGIRYASDGKTYHDILHSGNVGDYALKTDGSNAMSKGVLFSDRTLTESLSVRGTGIEMFKLVDNSSASPTGSLYFSVLHAVSSYAGLQLAVFGGIDNNLYYRKIGDSNTWSAWKTIAFTDSDITGTAAKAKNLVDSEGKSVAYVSGNTFYIGDSIYPTTSTQILGKDIRLRYGANASFGFWLNSSGNVTIGESDLAGTGAKLYVDGHIKLGASGYLYKNDKTVIDFAGDAPLFGYGTAAAGLGTKVYGFDIRLYYGGTTNVGFILNSSGNVGIGTNDPDEKLHVVGNLHVTGNIIADGEVSAGGAAEEGGNAGGGGAFYSDTIKEDTTQTTIAHGLGTDDIVVSIYEKDGVSGRWSLILTDVEIVDANNIIVSFGSATSVEHKVVIMGAVA